MSNIKFTMKDLDGTVMPYTSFVISTSTSANVASFTTNLNGEATVTLAAVSTPYYISKQDGTTESVIAYKFFVPDTTYTLDAELLFVDMGKISKDKNDKSIAALIEAKVVAVNAANRALQVVSLLGDVSTIRNNLTNLVQVASNLTNINAVNANATNINTVAGNTTNINKVATIDTNVTTVANNQSNVNTVATNIASVNTVVPHTANIGTVATNIGSVTTVSGSIASVNTTASNIANVNTVAGNTSNISTVAGISSEVTTVANSIADIQATAEGIGMIPVVLPYISNITTVASNIAPIIAVGNNINNINEVRAMEADIEVLADEIANIAGAAAAVTQAVDAQKVLYVAGTDYTKNTSNTLVLPYFPAKSNSVKIFFDGAYKNKDTWNRVGKNIAFTSAINADKVEIQYEIPSSFVGLSPEDILVIQNAEAAASASEVDAQQSATAAAVSASLAQGVANQAVDAIKQLFVAGTGFTKGVSTQLTMDFTPVKTNAVKVFFDGVYQNKNTFTRLGKALTFSEPLSVDTVEIQYEVPSQFVGLDDDDNAVLVAAQNAAQASANAAAASFDSFDDRYLGAKSVAPTVDNDGNVLLVGAKYFNSTENKMYVRNSSNVWQLDTADLSTVNYDGGTVQDVLDNIKPLSDYDALRIYNGRASTVRITTPGIAGFFRRIGSAADNGGTVIRGSAGISWGRVFDGAVNVKWFGAKGDGVVDDTVAIQAALASGNLNILIPSGTYCVTNVLYQTASYQTIDIHGNLFFDAAGNISPILIVTQTAIGSRRTGAGIIDHNGEQWAAGTGFADVLGGGGGDARGVAVLVMADNSIDDSYTVLNGWDCCFSLGNFNLTTGVQSAGPDCSRVSNLHTSNAGCGKHSWWAAPNGYYFQGVGVNTLTATNFVISNCTDYSSYGGFWADTNGGATGSFVNCTSVDCARGPVWSDAAAGSNQMWYTDGVFGGTITGAGAGWKKTPGGVAFMSGTCSISFVNCSAINPAWIGIALDQNSSGNEITNFRCVGSGGPGVIDAGLKNKFSQITLEDCCKYHGDVAPSGSICPVVAPFETVGQAGGYVEPTVSGLVIKSEPVYPSASPTAIKYPYALYARTSSGYVSRIGVGDADILSGTLGRVLCDTGSSVSLVSVTGSTTTVDTYGGDCVFDFKAQGNTAFQLAKTTAGDALITNFENGKQMIFGQAGPGSYAFWVNGIMKFGVNDANIIFGALPTVAPSVTGAIWRDPAAGNAIKIVP